MNSNNRDERLERIAQINGDKFLKGSDLNRDNQRNEQGDVYEDEDSLADLQTPKSNHHSRRRNPMYNGDMSFESVDQLKAENKSLKSNLYKIEDDMIQLKSERDTMVIKFNTLNEKVSKSLSSDKSVGRRMSAASDDFGNIQTMSQMNLQLRKQLDDDHREYKQKLSCNQEQQLKQVELIKRQQSKLDSLEGPNGVIERFKNENEKLKAELLKVKNAFTLSTTELNQRLDAAENQMKSAETDRSMDVESILQELKEEQAKCASLIQVNTLLSDQLDEATNANIGLTEDVQKLSDEWQIMRGELDQKEFDWKDDQATFSRYLASEQSRIKTLWNNAVNFKKQFNDIKAANDRDLHQIRVDVENYTQSLRQACVNFENNNRSKINQLEMQIETERNNANQLENLVQKLKEDLKKTEGQYQKQLETVNEQFSQLSRSNEQMSKELEEKDKTLTTLHKLRNGIVADMDNSVFDTENMATRQLIIDTDAVHQALRDIAQLVIDDNDHLDDSPWVQDDMAEESRGNIKGTYSTNSLHSNRSVSPVKATKKSQSYANSLEKQRMFRGKSPVSVADSTCAGVRSALQKRALQVQDLSSKLHSMKTNSQNLKIQLEDSENERRNIEAQLIEVRREFDSNHRELDDTQRECERLRHTIAMLEEEKSKLERNRLNSMEESKLDKQEIEKMKKTNYELQREVESLTDKGDEIQRNMERQVKEAQRLNKLLESTDGKNSKLKEEILSLKELLSKVSLEKEVLEQERVVAVESLNKVELSKAEFEVKYNKQRTDEAKLRDKIHQHELSINSLNKELIELRSVLEKTELERSRLTSEKKSLEQEKYGIREELIRVENEKEELHQLKHGLHESIQTVEKSYGTLQDELSKLSCEKVDLENKNAIVLRERNSLSTELLQARKDAERLSTAVQKLMKDKEALFNEKNDLASQINALDRELKNSANVIYLLREEKEQLDADFYESQDTIQKLESNIEFLQANLQQIEHKRSDLFDDKQKLQHQFDVELLKQNKTIENLHNKFSESEKEWDRLLKMEKKAREEDIERLISEREELRMESAAYRDQMKRQYIQENDDIRMRLNKDKEELAQEIITIQRERDDCLLEAEMTKQQAMSVLEHEKNVLLEKIAYLTDALKTTEIDLDRTRSECEARCRQDQEIVQSMNTDLKKFRSQFDQSHIEHDREIKNLQTSYSELENLRYQDHREIEELRSLLKIAEETRDGLRQDLNDSLARIREMEDCNGRLRRELQDEKRNYFEETKEVETLQISNKELRQKLKDNEILKINLQRSVQDLQQKLAVADEQRLIASKAFKECRLELQETEKARQDVRRELEDLRNQVKKIDTERGALFNEISGLQMRVSTDENKELETRKENSGLKLKVLESEATKEELSKQLYKSQKRVDELEDILNMKDKSQKQNYDELFKEFKKLEELKSRYEMQLDSFNTDIEDLKSTLIAKENKINSLENNLSGTDRKRKDAESRLAMIHNHLRKLIGFRQQAVSSLQNRSPSPSRKSRSISPDKGLAFDRQFTEVVNHGISQMYEGTVPGSDLEPEAVRIALRDITDCIANLKRERDDAEIKINNMSIKHHEVNSQLEQSLHRISLMQANFGEIEEDKKGIDGRLSSAQTALMMQEETIQRLERERKSLMDTVVKLERQLSILETDKKYAQDRVDKMRSAEAYYDEERRGLIKAVDDAENRCTQLELHRRGLEGDLQRLKMTLNDKETENQVLKDRIDSLMKQISDLESKAQSLQLTIDRLSMNLARTEEEENTQKDKVHQLNLTLNENQSNCQSLQEKLQQLQSNLANSEHDRRVLQERLECAKHTLSEAKSQNHNLADRLQSSEQELSESESRRCELEAETKRLSQVLKQRQEIEQEFQAKMHKAAMEKNLLSERLNSLTASLAGLESDRNDIEKSHSKIEKEKHALRKTLEKLENEKCRSEEIVNHTLLKREEFDQSVRRLEDENEVLQRQVQKLHNQLTESEQCHSQRLMDLTSRIKTEMLLEIDRLKSALCSTEKTLQFREKSHRQKVKGLEDQINLLKDQLSKELKKREMYLNKSARFHKNESSDIRTILERSANNGSNSPFDNEVFDADKKWQENLAEKISQSSTLKVRHAGRPHTSKSDAQKDDYFDWTLLRQTNPGQISGGKFCQISNRPTKKF